MKATGEAPPLEFQDNSFLRAKETDAHWWPRLQPRRWTPLAQVYWTVYDRGHDATHARAGLVRALFEPIENSRSGFGVPPMPAHFGELPHDVCVGVFFDMLQVSGVTHGRPASERFVGPSSEARQPTRPPTPTTGASSTRRWIKARGTLGQKR